MRLSLYTDYALRTLIYLAEKPGRTNVAEIAKSYGISRDHVAKAVQQLARLGFIRSIRGVGGGVELVRKPESIRIGEVVLAFEGNMNLLECVTVENVCSIQTGCRLKGVLAEAERIQSEYLNNILLSDVISPDKQLVELKVPPTNEL